MLRGTLLAIILAARVALPASADLLVPNQVINPSPNAAAGAIGIFGARVNGVPVTSPGFLGGGMASQVSISASVSDTIQVTFGFHWPFHLTSGLPILGVQFQNRLIYDNSEVQILGASGAGVFTAENFAGSFMTANTSTATTFDAGGAPLKGFPNPGTGIINTAPGFGRFAVNPPNTFAVPFAATTVNGATMAQGMLIPFSSTFAIMRVSLQAKSGVIGDNLVDLIVPPTSAFLLFNLLTTSSSVGVTNAFTPLFFTGSRLGLMGGDFGVDVVPEPASATLMGIGLFSLAGGLWRRRRRIGKG